MNGEVCTLRSPSARLGVLLVAAVSLVGLGCSRTSGSGEDAQEDMGEPALEAALAARNLGRTQDLVEGLVRESETASNSRRQEIADRLTAAAIELNGARRAGLAELCGRSALNIQRRIVPSDEARLVEILGAMGDSYWMQYQWGKVVGVLEEAIQILDHPQDPGKGRDVEQTLLVLNILADARRGQGDWDRAEALFSRAEGIATAADGQYEDILAHIVNNHAGLDRDRGNLAAAESRLQESLRRRLELASKDPEAIASARLNLAEVHRLQRNFSVAEPGYLEALKLAERLAEPNPQLHAYCVNQLSVLYAEEGQPEKAEEGYRNALKLRADAPGEERAQTLDELGRLLRRTGRSREAIPVLEESLKCREDDPDASAWDHAATLVELAAAEASVGPDGVAKAGAMVASALGVLGGTGFRLDAQIDAEALRADLYWKEGARLHARASLDQAIRIVETLRPRSGGGTLTRAVRQSQWRPLYDRMVSSLATDQPDAAFEYAERARARVLLDEFQTSGADFEAGIPAEVIQPLKRRLQALEEEATTIRARLTDRDFGRKVGGIDSADRTRLRSVEGEIAQLLEQIRNESPLWRATSGAPSASPEAGRSAAVPPGGSLLLYHVGEHQSWLFTLRADSRAAKAFPLKISQSDAAEAGCTPGQVGRDCVNRLVGTSETGVLRSLSSNPVVLVPEVAPGGQPLSEPRLVEGLNRAWRVLVPAEIRRRIVTPGAGPVVVIPDGVLRHLPFEALVVDASSTGTVKYWLDVGPPIIYADSASAVVALDKRATERDDLRGKYLLVAGSEDSLPGSRREVEIIQERIRTSRPGSEIEVLIGAEATEPKVTSEMDHARLIHVSSHGIVDPGQSAYFASLTLTPPAKIEGGSDDGSLQLHEIYRLNLQAEVTVLSACDGQVGRDVEGEGVFALSRGFLASGSDRVISSLWKVDDKASSDLVDHLYSHAMSRSDPGRPAEWAVALRDAKCDVRTHGGWTHPYYWAAFTYQGVVH